MKSKLEAIEGIETAGEKKIWEYIESIFQTSNPNYIRRQDCLTLRQKKGETTSEFSDRFKKEFIESDMVNATIWWLTRWILTTLMRRNSRQNSC